MLVLQLNYILIQCLCYQEWDPSHQYSFCIIAAVALSSCMLVLQNRGLYFHSICELQASLLDMNHLNEKGLQGT